MQVQQSKQIDYVDNECQLRSYLIEEQGKEIDKIEENMKEVNEMFYDINMLVKEQRFMVDNIESHIENTVENVDEGVENIRQAEKSQEKFNLFWWLVRIVRRIVS